MERKKKPQLDKAYSKIIKSALQGKNTESLKEEFYKIVSLELGSEIKELPKAQQKKIKQEINKFDDKLLTRLESDLDKDLEDGILSSSESKSLEKNLKKSIKVEQFDLQKEIDNFKNHGKKQLKNISKSNGVTLDNLIQSTFKFSENRKSNTEVKYIKLNDVEWSFEKETLLFNLDVVGKSDKLYNVFYMFYEISDSSFENKKTINIKDKISKEIKLVESPTIKDTGVCVSCTCEDYKYTFSYSNLRFKCNFGDISANFKQRPEVKNPSLVKGICRHIFSGIYFLKKQNLIY